MSTSTERNWANLPLDLLSEIANRLTIRDCRRFRRVCTSWASVDFPYMPYLLLPGDDGPYQSLLSATDHTSFPAPILTALRGKWCIGSQDSWLATLDECFQASLLNLITGEEIKLPSILTHPRFNIAIDYSIQAWKLRSLLPRIVFSPNPSPASYTAVALLGYPSLKFMYTRAGENKWTTVEELGHAQDVIYHDGRFLAMSEYGEIVAVDLSVDGRPLEVIIGRSAEFSLSSIKYLVDSTGDLLQVRRYFENTTVGDGDMMEIKTRRIEVFGLDARRDVWVAVESLGDRSLFVGTRCSFFLSAQEIPGLKGNRVYFTDDLRPFFYRDKRRGATCDVGVFSLEDGSIEPCLPDPIPCPKPNCRPPTWIILPKALLGRWTT